MDKVYKDIVTGEWKKQSLEYYIGRMVLISLISLRRLLRQRGFVSFRLLFLVTTQRVSRCSLPSLRGRGTSMSFITYVIMTSVHYGILASASLLLYLYIVSPLCLYVIMSSVPLLLCLLHTQSLMSLCHSGFCSLCTFWLHKCKGFLQTSYFVGNLWVASWAISSLFVSHV